jgi:glycosyltransferase involved in cell wall biosynthesis
MITNEILQKNSVTENVPSEKIRVLQVTTIDLTAYCFLRNWFKYLEKSGVEVTLATTVEQFEKEIEETGARVINIPISRKINPTSDLISLYKLFKFIKKEKFHAVHTYTTKAGFIGRLAAKLAGTPVIIHTMFEPPHNSTKNPVLKSLYIILERFASAWADMIFTITKPNVKEILDKKLVPVVKLSLIPEGIDIEKYDAVKAEPEKIREDLGIPPKASFILTVARLENVKGHIYFLKAAANLVKEGFDGYFICVGKGKLKETLESKARALGIESRVKFTGFRYDMLEIMKSCDLFVLPSLWEGQGVVLLEAMAFKKPVIACRVGGVTDVVTEDETGILVPPADPAALEKAIKNLLDRPQD